MFELMPTQMWEDLQRQTHSNLSVVESSEAQMIKFVCVHDVRTLAVVISERHIKVDIEAAYYSKVSEELRKAFEISDLLSIDIRFAGQVLRESDTLANIGVFYPDKVYLSFDLARATGPGVFRLIEYDNYVMNVANYIQKQPEAYLGICEEIISLIRQKNHQEVEMKNLWQRLILLRNMPAVVVNAGTPKLILDCISELLIVINSLNENENIHFLYNILSALEWLVYLSPSAFDVVGRGEIVLKSFVDKISQIIKAQNLPIALRMEAIWTLGWAGIAQPNIRTIALPLLNTLVAEVNTPIIRQTLRAAGLRMGYFRSAYSWASVSREAGSFIPLSQDTSATTEALVGTEIAKLFSKALETATQERKFLEDLHKSVNEKATEHELKNILTAIGKKYFKISVAHPKLLTKRFESAFLIQAYFEELNSDVKAKIREILGENVGEHVYDTELKLGQLIKIKLYSPDIIFPEPITKKLNSPLNSMTFLGKPLDTCQPGEHKVVLSILDNKTGVEYQSETFSVKVVDFAFDHISRPLLSRVSAVVLGIGSFAMFILTFLEQIDKTVGLTSGTAAGVLALAVYAGFYNMYQRVHSSTP